MNSQCWMSKSIFQPIRERAFCEFDFRIIQNSIVLDHTVTITAAFGAESRSKRLKGYNKTPTSIMSIKLSTVIERECLERHMIIQFSIRHAVFVVKIEIKRLCVANVRERFDYSLSVPSPFRRSSG